MTLLKCIGLMSGTSMDGIEAALIETDGQTQIKQIYTASLTYNHTFRNLLKEAEAVVRTYNGDLKLAHSNYPKLASIIQQSTLLHIELIKQLLTQTKISTNDIDLIGYHGQSLYHNPAQSITVAVGNPQFLAENLGIPVIANFRNRDVENGGQGAPFAPIYHQALSVRDKNYPLAVVNCGGIANVTFIDGANPNNLIGFDTGPGNILIDQYIRTYSNNQEFMDKDGKYGNFGEVNSTILNKLYQASIPNKNSFFKTLPPKSLDPGDFYLIEEIFNLSPEDACKTLASFTAYIIAESIDLVKIDTPLTWVLCGGGWNNPVITEELNKYLVQKLGTKLKLVMADEIGWDKQYMEAEIFAYIAVRSLHGLPSSYPSITNVNAPTIAGTAYLPVSVSLPKHIDSMLAKISL